eukprot:TRINITY_DN78_c0_g1_i1.p1 TRINITY_DN78_c0_g1~~TRINITY_DN78_c0_g1_i1.p1  ORF type:complete len:469 (+),score=83.70 TRINITY_DN78_c0_g1_i1:1478-2884(+)
MSRAHDPLPFPNRKQKEEKLWYSDIPSRLVSGHLPPTITPEVWKVLTTPLGWLLGYDSSVGRECFLSMFSWGVRKFITIIDQRKEEMRTKFFLKSLPPEFMVYRNRSLGQGVKTSDRIAWARDLLTEIIDPSILEEILKCPEHLSKDQHYCYLAEVKDAEKENFSNEIEKKDTTEKKMKNRENSKEKTKNSKENTKNSKGRKKNLKGKDKTLKAKDKTLKAKDKTLKGKDKTFKGKDKTLKGKDKTLNGKDKTLNGKDKTLNGKDKTLNGNSSTKEKRKRSQTKRKRDRKTELKYLKKKIENLEKQMETIKHERQNSKPERKRRKVEPSPALGGPGAILGAVHLQRVRAPPIEAFGVASSANATCNGCQDTKGKDGCTSISDPFAKSSLPGSVLPSVALSALAVGISNLQPEAPPLPLTIPLSLRSPDDLEYEETQLQFVRDDDSEMEESSLTMSGAERPKGAEPDAS